MRGELATVVFKFMCWWLLLLLCSYFVSAEVTRFQKEESLRISPHEHFNRTITIGAPISFDMDDVHFSSGRTMMQAWKMFTEWVNNHGGINFHGENVSITLVCVEDYSDSDYVEEGVNILLNSTPPTDLFLAPYTRLIILNSYCSHSQWFNLIRSLTNPCRVMSYRIIFAAFSHI